MNNRSEKDWRASQQGRVNNPSESHGRAEIEAWGALVTRVLAFVAGILLIAHDALLQQGQPTELRLAFLFAGIALTGPVASSSLAEIFIGFRGKDDG